jgi:Protein of unknown function (DUF1153)
VPIYVMFTQWLRPALIVLLYPGWLVCECVPSIMTEQQMRARVRYVIGPDGSPLTVADLPPKDTKRWVIRRKAEVVAAVRGGLLSIEEACERYKLTVDEFLSWQRSIDKHGLPGLRATRIQEYRD